VLGKYRGKGKWFPGSIAAKHEDNTVDVNYNDGDKDFGLKLEFIRLVATELQGSPQQAQPAATSPLSGILKTEESVKSSGNTGDPSKSVRFSTDTYKK
jgi:hypothetical protein